MKRSVSGPRTALPHLQQKSACSAKRCCEQQTPRSGSDFNQSTARGWRDKELHSTPPQNSTIQQPSRYHPQSEQQDEPDGEVQLLIRAPLIKSRLRPASWLWIKTRGLEIIESQVTRGKTGL